MKPVFKKTTQTLKRWFLPSVDNHEPLALSKMAFVVYGLTVMLLVGIAYPYQESVFQSFFAAITQDLVIAEVNPARQELGNIGPLSPHPKLTQAAQMKAEDMIARDYFSHNSPEGERPWIWLKKVDYKYALAGENLAIDFNDPYLVTKAWLNSPSHRKNILNNYYTDIGIGVAEGEYQGRNTVVTVMFLGKEITPTLESLAVSNTIETPNTPTEPRTIASLSSVRNGDLLRTEGSEDVYIVKINGDQYYKRLILNPNIFDSYDHLSWNNIKTVEETVLQELESSQMVMEVYPDGTPVSGDIYVLVASEGSDVGTKHHLKLTAEEFTSLGYDWSSVYLINDKEASDLFYPEGVAITRESLPTFALTPEFKGLLTEEARLANVAGANIDTDEMDKIQVIKDSYLAKEAEVLASVTDYVANAVNNPSKFWTKVKVFLLDSLPQISKNVFAIFLLGLLVWVFIISITKKKNILFFAPRVFTLALLTALLLL
ncbi:MAG: CAP domain-containing protein [Candidatus Spechtbacterales bacterium]|nr:CAP domain-containing protein [Candidatus Spechtbacterales bacterium]